MKLSVITDPVFEQVINSIRVLKVCQDDLSIFTDAVKAIDLAVLDYHNYRNSLIRENGNKDENGNLIPDEKGNVSLSVENTEMVDGLLKNKLQNTVIDVKELSVKEGTLLSVHDAMCINKFNSLVSAS